MKRAMVIVKTVRFTKSLSKGAVRAVRRASMILWQKERDARIRAFNAREE